MRKHTDPPENAPPDSLYSGITPAYARTIVVLFFFPLFVVLALHFEVKALLVTGQLHLIGGATYNRESLYGAIGVLLACILAGGAAWTFHSAISRQPNRSTKWAVRLMVSMILATGAALWLALGIVFSWIVGPVTYIPVDFERLGREVIPGLVFLLVIGFISIAVSPPKKKQG